MSYLRTVISFKEEEHNFLKDSAAKKRQSMASLVREAVQDKMNQTKDSSPEEVEKFMLQIRKHAKATSKYLKGVDGVKIIREMRDNAKW